MKTKKQTKTKVVGSKQVKCDDCGKEMSARNLRRHRAESCPSLPQKSLAECEACGKEVLARNLVSHKAYGCPYRLQLCRRCGRDTVGKICIRCREGGTHTDEERDRKQAQSAYRY